MRFVAITGLALLLSLAGCGPQGAPSVKFQLTDVTGADFGKSLALTDHTGKPRTLADFQGKVVVIFFGFTQCPDVCPTTLAEMAKVLRELGADGEKVQVLFVSVDPERDTQELLKQYVTAFHPSCRWLSWPRSPACRRQNLLYISWSKTLREEKRLSQKLCIAGKVARR